MPLIIDSYDESNQESGYPLYNPAAGGLLAAGQAFTGNGTIVNTCTFNLRTVGIPTGTLVAKLYAHTGSYGSTSKPTGAALATSDIYDVTIIPPTFYGLRIFRFSTPYLTVNGTNYCVVCEFNAVSSDANNLVNVGRNSSSPTHGGNGVTTTDNSVWSADASRDAIFYVTNLDKRTPSNYGRYINVGQGQSRNESAK